MPRWGHASDLDKPLQVRGVDACHRRLQAGGTRQLLDARQGGQQDLVDVFLGQRQPVVVCRVVVLERRRLWQNQNVGAQTVELPGHFALGKHRHVTYCHQRGDTQQDGQDTRDHGRGAFPQFLPHDRSQIHG